MREETSCKQQGNYYKLVLFWLTKARRVWWAGHVARMGYPTGLWVGKKSRFTVGLYLMESQRNKKADVLVACEMFELQESDRAVWYGWADPAQQSGLLQVNWGVISMTHQHKGHWNINWKLLGLWVPLLSSEYIMFWEILLFKRTDFTDKRKYYKSVLQLYPSDSYSVTVSQQKVNLPFSLMFRWPCILV